MQQRRRRSKRDVARRVRPFSRELLRDEVAPGDLELLLLGVAGELDDLHAVAQRRRDRVEHVGGGDEHHLREVERHVEVVVQEACCSAPDRAPRAAPRPGSPRKSAPSLSISSSMKSGLFEPGVAQALDDAAGQGADVGAAVAADLGLVAHAAEREADELAPHGARDRAAERRLADARRADEAEDRALAGPSSACARRGTRGCGP